MSAQANIQGCLNLSQNNINAQLHKVSTNRMFQ